MDIKSLPTITSNISIYYSNDVDTHVRFFSNQSFIFIGELINKYYNNILRIEVSKFDETPKHLETIIYHKISDFKIDEHCYYDYSQLHDPTTLKYITQKNYHEMFFVNLIRKNWKFIKYIDNITYKIIKKALEKNPAAIKYKPKEIELSRDEYMDIVKRNYKTLLYVPKDYIDYNFLKDMNPKCLRYLEHWYFEDHNKLYFEYAMKDYRTLRYLPIDSYLSENECKQLINNNPKCMRYLYDKYDYGSVFMSKFIMKYQKNYRYLRYLPINEKTKSYIQCVSNIFFVKY